jgi:tRNA isopentenyl-2-thiomethyl-A-37 hydroxylase MiaE
MSYTQLEAAFVKQLDWANRELRTTEQWWDDVSNDPEKLILWLKDQFYGEQTAAARIRGLLDQYPDITKTERELVTMIADDEDKHAEWVKGLLIARGIPVTYFREKSVRYWDKTLPKGDATFSQMCAIGHHAEVMRLERIKLLAQDGRFDDIARVFGKILPDEEFHTKAFKVMSTPEDIAAALPAHQEGMNALGLVA